MCNSLEQILRNNLEADVNNNSNLRDYYIRQGNKELREYHEGRLHYALKILNLMDVYNAKAQRKAV